MDNKIKGEKNIKATVLISYAVIVILIASIVYFTFTSFQKLTESSDKLAQPNLRIGLLHEIVFSIYNAEGQIRSFTLSEKKEYLDQYFEELLKINEMVNSLTILAEGDEYFLRTIDSINVQLFNKTQLLEEFIHLKKQDRNSVLYEKAIDDIIQITEKETRIKKVTYQSILNQIPPFPVQLNPQDSLVETESDSAEPTVGNEDNNQEKTNFITRLKNLFSAQPQPLEDKQIIVEADDPQRDMSAPEMVQQVRTDSIITHYQDTEELRAAIENKLIALMQIILENQQEIKRMENLILSEDKKVMDKIWNYVTVLQDYESENALKQAENAHSTVGATTDKIFATVVSSLLLILVFSWLFISDINKSRFYKKQLIQQKSRAEELVKVKQRFMANLSHEIRTPLNSIIGFSRQLEKYNLEEEYKTYVNAINKSSSHLEEIVNDILDFSKIEAGKINLEVIPFDLNEILDEVYNSLKIIALQKNLELKLDTDNLRYPQLLGDPLRIKQVLFNIAGNAIKFTNEGYIQIIVSDYVKKENPNLNYVHFRIVDTGIGIPESEQKTIFEEFAQADNQPTRKHKGTGLGLSISKRLVEIMNGNIEFFSHEGRGSAFSFHLPMIITENPQILNQETKITLKQNNAIKLLLIDDDDLNRLLFKTFFSSIEKVSFFEAESPIKGMAMLNEQKFDLIITDIQMPGISGIEMIKQLKQNSKAINSSTPVLACTADITPETLKEIKDSGIEDYLLKPVDENQLLRKLDKLLSSSHHEPVNGNNNMSIKGNKKLYDLKGLMAFTGNDPKSVIPVIEVFINDTRNNIAKLDEGLRNNNKEEIFGLIHKMDNMFGLLKAENALYYLKKLNSRKNNGITPQEIEQDVRNIIKISEIVIESLNSDLKAIISGSYYDS